MRRQLILPLTIPVIACFLLMIALSPGVFASPVAQAGGQDYFVKAGDSLVKIATAFYGDSSLWPLIVEGTNAKAAEDPTYGAIEYPRLLRIGQKLWIQDLEEDGPHVQFVRPLDGATVSPTFEVAMEAPGLTVEPAGEIHEGAGHMHILVDSDFVEPGDIIPFDEVHLHYGRGQLTTVVTLTPGIHVLRLQFADGGHIALEGDQYRDTITVTVAAETPPAASDAGQSVRFVRPLNGAIVSTTFEVAMEANGLTVEPAGEIHEGAGHMHILVDTDFVEPGEIVPFDEEHLHYGRGQLTTTLTLTPGIHVLNLQFADGGHIALDGDQYRDTITITVSTEAATPLEVADEGPGVRFARPLDGAVVSPTFEVAMEATELIVEPAGEIHEGAGHMHILVDTDFVEPGEVILFDEQHLHFGRGQLTTTLTLTPGVHVLNLQFANGGHIALDGDQYRDTITVTVAAGTSPEVLDNETGVFFVSPLNGTTVSPTFEVVLEAIGLIVEPSGEIHEGAGHMHVLVDTDFIEAGEVVLFDEQHLHLGRGQLTTTLTLTPGVHLLNLQFADGGHIALDGDQYRDTITVTVAAETAVAAEPEAHEHGVRFVEPLDGAVVSQTFEVAMEATGLTVEPAGEIHEGAGHMHILVDTDFVEPGEVVLFDEQHLHFGQGQLTTTLTLTPGIHVLNLQFANGGHIALEGGEYRDTITVTVAE